MENFLNDILAEVQANGETAADLQSVRINSCLGYDYLGELTDPRNAAVRPVVGKLLSWEDASKLLDYQYGSGYGAMDCHDIVIWSTNYIYYIHEYDGSTAVVSIDRNPIAIE